MKFEKASPLDYSNNEARDDKMKYKMAKINDKISGNMQSLRSNHDQIEVLNEQAYQKQVSATSNGFMHQASNSLPLGTQSTNFKRST